MAKGYLDLLPLVTNISITGLLHGLEEGMVVGLDQVFSGIVLLDPRRALLLTNATVGVGKRIVVQPFFTGVKICLCVSPNAQSGFPELWNGSVSME